MNRRSHSPSHRIHPRLEVLEAKQLLAAFVVTSTADTGAGSLRQAILDVDAATNDPTAVPEITFAIPGNDVQPIYLTTPLPAITRAVVVDGTTQPGYDESPLIFLDGANVTTADGSPAVGLEIDATDRTLGTAVRGIGIGNFSGSGLVCNAAAATISGVVIGTNYLGGRDEGNGGYGILFGNLGGNVVGGGTVPLSVIDNNGLRAIGGVEDRPGVDTPSDAYVTTGAIAESLNDTKATTLVVSTTNGSSGISYTSLGGSTTVTYTVTNTGTNPATDVGLDLTQDAFNKSLTVISGTASQGTIESNLAANSDYPAFARLGTIAPGASATVTVTVQFQQDLNDSLGVGQLFAVATSPQIDYAAINTQAFYLFSIGTQPNYFVAPTPPEHQLTVTTPTGQYDDEYVQWGGIVPMSFTVTNTGTATATDVTLSIGHYIYSHLLTILSATTTQGTVGSDLSIADSHPDYASIGTLAPGASATLTIVAQVGPVDSTDPDDGGDQNTGTHDDSELVTATAHSADVPVSPYDKISEYTLVPNLYRTGPLVGSTETTTSVPGPTVGDPVPTPTGTGTATGTALGGQSPGGTIIDGPSLPLSIAPADLAISIDTAVAPRVGTAGLYMLSVQDVGTDAAGDAKVALDLSAFPPGSLYAIQSMTSAGASGTLTQVPGRPGIFLVDLGALAIGSSATIAVMVLPHSTGSFGLLAAVSDAASSVPDLNLGNNFASTSTLIGPAVQVAAATMTPSGLIQLDLDSALKSGQASSLAHYKLSTAATGTTPARTIRLRSAHYDSTSRRVTLRLAQAVPAAATQFKLAITGLGAAGTTGTTTIDLARSRRAR